MTGTDVTAAAAEVVERAVEAAVTMAGLDET